MQRIPVRTKAKETIPQPGLVKLLKTKDEEKKLKNLKVKGKRHISLTGTLISRDSQPRFKNVTLLIISTRDAF